MKYIDITSRRYIGNKSKLSDWIFDNIQKYTTGNSFFDVFAGTGSISSKALNFYDSIYINDFLVSNNLIYKAFFEDAEYNINKLNNIVNYFNSLDSKKLSENYFDKNFGDKYFGKFDARKIGFIREELSNLRINKKINDKEYNILLSSLIYSIDKIANTVGHYEAYIKNNVLDNKLYIKLINVFNTKNKKINIYREDANKLAPNIISEIVFLDPPYNSRQYSRFYHLIENLVEWEKPKLFGVALKPSEKNMSEYCRKKAPEVFNNLILSLNCKYIVTTYNNTYNSKSSSSINKISFKEILNSLNSVGKTKIFEKDYNYFNAGKTNFDNHKEFLFITEVSNEKHY